MSSNDKTEGKTLTQHIGDALQSASDTVMGKSATPPTTKTEAHKQNADSAAGSTWENIKSAASSAKDQAASKIDKNTSEFQAKTKEGGESLGHSVEKAGAKAEEKEHKADTKSYLTSAWEGVKDTASSLTGAAGSKAEKYKDGAEVKATEAREKAADKIDPHK